MASSGGATLALEADGSIRVGGAVPDKDTITLECSLDVNGITGFRLEALPDPALPSSGPGLPPNGNFVLTEFQVQYAPKNSDGWKPALLERPSADFEQAGFGIVGAIDGSPTSGWAVAPECGISHEAVFETQRDLGFDAGVKLILTLDFQWGYQHELGRFRLSFTTSPRPLLAQRDMSAILAAQGRIQSAIARGVSFLLDEQELDGSWSSYQNQWRHGATALCCYALFKCGLKRTHPAIERAVDFMLAAPPTGTYEAGLELMALAALEDPAFDKRIQETTDRLLSWQVGGFSYPAGAPDLSNTQYAALGLRAAAERGARIPTDAWIKLGEEVLTHQEKPGSAYQGAGFGYAAGGPAYGSITAGGVCVLRICEEQLGRNQVARAAISAGLKRGLAWLDRYFLPDTNPLGGGWIYYWLYGVERVGGLCGVIELGRRNWYREGARFIVDSQAPGGSWNDAGGPQPTTAFALLFLTRATSSVSGVSVRSENLYGGDDAAVAVNLRAAGDTPLAVWVSSFGEEARDRYGWEEDERRGPRVARVDYVLPGRALLADARTEAAKWRVSFEPPTGGWEQPAFDDSKWKAAPGAFGPIGSTGAPVRTEWNSDQIWLRRRFLAGDEGPVDPLLVILRSSEEAPAGEPSRPDLVCLFDEEPGFAKLVNESAGGTIRVEEKEPFRGRICLAVTPQQVFRAAMPGWSFGISGKPGPGEYRWLRFAWRKEGGGGIMLQVAQNGTWDANTRRFYAGPNELQWPGSEVDRTAPRRWSTVTIDLAKEFGGRGTLTGIAFTPMSGVAGWFDAIYLARSLDDLAALSKTGAVAGGAGKAPPPPSRATPAGGPGSAPPAAPASLPLPGAPVAQAEAADGSDAAGVTATGAGPALEIFLNGTRVLASDEEFPDHATVAPQVALGGLLRSGSNVLAVYSRRTSAGQSLDVGLEDQHVLATVAGNGNVPAGGERFPARLEFPRNGSYALRARVHVRPPPFGKGDEASLEPPRLEAAILESPPLEITIREARDPELLSYAKDPARNLIPKAGATASASSAFDGGWLASFAIDNLSARGWLSADGDRHPTLSIQLEKPVRADTVLVTPLQLRGADPERRFQVRRVEVQVDQGRGGTYEITMPAEFRKGVLELPKVMVVRRLDVRVLDASGVHPTKSALGLAEVELQLRR
jgi:hypothetical protein